MPTSRKTKAIEGLCSRSSSCEYQNIRVEADFKVGRLNCSDVIVSRWIQLFIDRRGLTLDTLRPDHSHWEREEKIFISAGTVKSEMESTERYLDLASTENIYPAFDALCVFFIHYTTSVPIHRTLEAIEDGKQHQQHKVRPQERESC